MEKTLEKFIKYWKEKSYVVGILLTGSYAIDQQNESSDIDIRIFFEIGTKTVKGYIIIDGYKFSYLGRSYEKSKKIMDYEFSINNKLEVNTINIGKILYEKSNIIQDLKKIAQIYLLKKFTERKKSEEELKTMIYILFNYMNYMNSLKEDSPFFIYTYMLFMKLSLRYYSDILNFENVSDLKIEKLFTNAEYRTKCNWDDFPDTQFIMLWLNSINKAGINKKNLRTMFDYLKDRIYNFDEKKIEITWND